MYNNIQHVPERGSFRFKLGIVQVDAISSDFPCLSRVVLYIYHDFCIIVILVRCAYVHTQGFGSFHRHGHTAVYDTEKIQNCIYT